MTIKKILIANRGEIACRVIQTAKKLGIATVAVYSEADAQSLHVQLADEAIAIGPAPSIESYLKIDKIIDAVKQSGADAVHPGFGFLSENAKFVEALKEANITFIGPDTLAIQAMGDKIESKKLALNAKVSCVPGDTQVLKDGDHALQVATQITCPVMLKASAGGGGKGMRIAWTLDDVKDAFRSAQNEARSSFADDRIFVEKFIEQPRHIEIQVLADQHGQCIYLAERECSIQRRHQKLIEEAPSPFLDETTRQAMGEQAVRLAKAVDYQSAGTVEFIVDKDKNFYFLEMNTRLQVEHPVTEFITGLDLVEQMIRVAEGKPLPLEQKDVKINGWAIETRIYAEDPERNFMPSTGRLTHYKPPESNDTVRVDTGVIEGSDISIYYDPMIAKLITYAEDRSSAIDAMKDALNAYVIRGISHNIPFLSALIAHHEFLAGNLTTNFIDEYFDEGFDSTTQTPANQSLLVALACHLQTEKENSIIKQPETIQYTALVGDTEFNVSITQSSSDSSSLKINETEHTLSLGKSTNPIRMIGEFDNQPFTLQVDREGLFWRLTHHSSSVLIKVFSPHVAKLNTLMPIKVAPDMSQFLLSPMPGLLVKVLVNEGDKVESGQELAIVEAMKMENILRATRDGVIETIHCNENDSLSQDQMIMAFTS